jgi:hypothetical protein
VNNIFFIAIAKLQSVLNILTGILIIAQFFIIRPLPYPIRVKGPLNTQWISLLVFSNSFLLIIIFLCPSGLPGRIHILSEKRHLVIKNGFVAKAAKSRKKLRRPGDHGWKPALDPWLCVPGFHQVCLFRID